MPYQPTYKYLPPASYSWGTPLYDFFCTILGLGKKYKKKVLAALQITSGMAVADIGCGTGVFLAIAKENYPDARFIGLDPDKEALRIAERRLKKSGHAVELMHAFAESLPLPDQSVDICVSSLAFHHMPDDIKEKAIKEIHRVLKPGGTVVIADFGASHSTFFRKALFFEKVEYIEGNFKGLLPKFLREAGFSEPEIVGRHAPGIVFLKARKSL
ncbi:MAG: class I SAM-dependent methyltransferase [Patescibacteria group bacterium]